MIECGPGLVVIDGVCVIDETPNSNEGSTADPVVEDVKTAQSSINELDAIYQSMKQFSDVICDDDKCYYDSIEGKSEWNIIATKNGFFSEYEKYPDNGTCNGEGETTTLRTININQGLYGYTYSYRCRSTGFYTFTKSEYDYINNQFTDFSRDGVNLFSEAEEMSLIISDFDEFIITNSVLKSIDVLQLTKLNLSNGNLNNTNPVYTPKPEVVIPQFRDVNLNKSNFEQYFTVNSNESNGFLTSVTITPKSNFEIIYMQYTVRIDARYYDSTRRALCNAQYYPEAVGRVPAVRERLVDNCVAQSPSYSVSEIYNVTNTSRNTFITPFFNYQYPRFSQYSKNSDFNGQIRIRVN